MTPFNETHITSLDRLGSVTCANGVAYFELTVVLEESQQPRTDIFSLSLASREATPTCLTDSLDALSNTQPYPVNGVLYFLSASQVWAVPLDDSAAPPFAVTTLPLPVGTFRVHRDMLYCSLELAVGAAMSLAEAVDSTVSCNKSDGHDVRVFDSLPVRNWDAYVTPKLRQHVVRLPLRLDTSSTLAPGSRVAILDDPLACDMLSASAPVDCPTRAFGDEDCYAISDDFVAMCCAPLDATDTAITTNTHIYLASATDTAGSELTCLTKDNAGYDSHPTFSPSGRQLAYLSTEAAACESAPVRLKVLDLNTRETRTLLPEWDYSVASLLWRDEQTLLITALRHGRTTIVSVDVATESLTECAGTFKCVQVCFDSATNTVVFIQHSFDAPPQIYARFPDTDHDEQLTRINSHRLASLVLSPSIHEYSFPGAHGDPVHAYLLEPVPKSVSPTSDDPDGTRNKVPLLVLIHGGPEGAFDHSWGTRWNPQVFAGGGYATLIINFHGSTGYGHAFTESILNNWGSAPFTDIIEGVRDALVRFPFIDGTRVAAAGASYGGFMVNWMLGNAPQGMFKCFICHAGIFSTSAFYYSTEELYFPEAEFHGTPFGNPQAYAQFDPSLHVAKWRTPTLVTHGELDYRIVISQGLSTFTALQRQNVPSRLLVFPRENHWVLKRENSAFWYSQVLEWLNRWCSS